MVDRVSSSMSPLAVTTQVAIRTREPAHRLPAVGRLHGNDSNRWMFGAKWACQVKEMLLGKSFAYSCTITWLMNMYLVLKCLFATYSCDCLSFSDNNSLHVYLFLCGWIRWISRVSWFVHHPYPITASSSDHLWLDLFSKYLHAIYLAIPPIKETGLSSSSLVMNIDVALVKIWHLFHLWEATSRK